MNNLAALFGGHNRKVTAGKGRESVVHGDDDFDTPLPVRPAKQTKEQLRKENLVKAKERERKQYERYKATREHRLSRLQEAHPGVTRYLRTLERIGPDATVPRANDCDFDLAELACRCGVDAIPADYDRFVIFELTQDWLQRVGKRKGHPEIPEDEDMFSNPYKDTALGDLKTALRIR